MGLQREPSHMVIPIRAESDVTELRQLVRTLALGGIGSRVADPAEDAAAVLGGLLLRGGTDGYVLVRAFGAPGSHGVEILAVEHRAPSGDGEPARGDSAPAWSLSRLWGQADVVDAATAPGVGQIVLARFHLNAPPPASWLRWGGVSLPSRPGDANGDAWAVGVEDSTATVLLVDGLGHGHRAAEAASVAVEALGGYDGGDTLAWLTRAQHALRTTRGCVLGLAQIDRRRGVLRYAGIGNVTCHLVTRGQAKAISSMPGTIGTSLTLPRARLVELPWQPDSALLLWSDGIRSDTDVRDRLGLLDRDPAVVAALLHRDHRRDDDATVVVVRGDVR